MASFAAYSYYPCLQCSDGELLGYRMLSGADKDAILPVIEISYRNRMAFDDSIAAIAATVEKRPFILDLCHEPAPAPYISKSPKDKGKDARRVADQQKLKEEYDQSLSAAINPRNGFEQWRKIAAQFPNAVPVLQFSDVVDERQQVLRQASLFFAEGRRIAVRVLPEVAISRPDLIAQIVSISPQTENVLIILDCGQGRQRISDRAVSAVEAIARVRDQIDISQRASMSAVCVSSSFTQPPGPFPRDYESREPELWRQASEAFPFLLGDYAAMYRRTSATTFVPGEWVATVVCPLDDSWLVYKHDNQKDASGWIEGAKAVVGMLSAAGEKMPRVWGGEVIARACRGDLSDADKVSVWHAVKVNIHIHRQIKSAPSRISDYSNGDAED